MISAGLLASAIVSLLFCWGGGESLGALSTLLWFCLQTWQAGAMLRQMSETDFVKLSRAIPMQWRSELPHDEKCVLVLDFGPRLYRNRTAGVGRRLQHRGSAFSL